MDAEQWQTSLLTTHPFGAFGLPNWHQIAHLPVALCRALQEDGSADSSGLHANGAAGSHACTQGIPPLPAFEAALPQPAAGQQQQPAFRAPPSAFGAAPQPSFGAPALPAPGLQGLGQAPPQQQQPVQIDWHQQLQTVLASLLPQQPPQPVAAAPLPQPSLGSVLSSILGGSAGTSQWSDGTPFAAPRLQQQLTQGAVPLAAVQQLASLLQQQPAATRQTPQAQQLHHLLEQAQHVQQAQQEQQQQHIQQVLQHAQHNPQVQQGQQAQAQQQQEQPPLDGFAAFAPAAQQLVSAPSGASAGVAAASGAASGSLPGAQQVQEPARLQRGSGDDSSYNQLALAVQQSGPETTAAATTDTGGSGPGDGSVGPASENQPRQLDADLTTGDLVRQLVAVLPDLSQTAALLRKAAEQLQAHLAAQRLLQGEAAPLAAQLPGARALAGPNAGAVRAGMAGLGAPVLCASCLPYKGTHSLAAVGRNRYGGLALTDVCRSDSSMTHLFSLTYLVTRYNPAYHRPMHCRGGSPVRHHAAQPAG